MIKILVVGGPLDGNRMDYQTDDIKDVPPELVISTPVIGIPLKNHNNIYFEHKRYRIIPLGVYGKRNYVFLYESITIDELIELLVTRYPLPLPDRMREPI